MQCQSQSATAFSKGYSPVSQVVTASSTEQTDAEAQDLLQLQIIRFVFVLKQKSKENTFPKYENTASQSFSACVHTNRMTRVITSVYLKGICCATFVTHPLCVGTQK